MARSTRGNGFAVREIRPEDVPAARALMIRTFDEDFGTGYVPAYHWDVDDIAGVYITAPRHVLYVAIDDLSGEMIGTGGVRGGALKSEGSPERLVRRYDDLHTAQLVRVYTSREHRRRGVARALVRAALEYILADPEYTLIALHTYRHSPGAVGFWGSIGTTVVTEEQEAEGSVVFFEIPLEQARRFVERPA